MAAQTGYPGTLLVTGPLEGLGKAIALAFAAKKCKSIFLATHEPEEAIVANIAEEIQRQHPNTTCLYNTSPVVSEEGSASMMQKCIQAFGSIDYVVNLAGKPSPRKDLLNTGPDEFDAYLEQSMYPLFFDLQAQFRHWDSQTRRHHPMLSIVNVSSVLGLATTQESLAESAGQHGVVGLTRSCALDYASKGVRVNCVCPGAREDMLSNDPSRVEDELEKVPIKKLCKIQEVVDPILFLSSPRASGISGHALTIDGAWMLHHI